MLWFFHVWVWELDHKEVWVSAKELMFLNCAVGEDSWESLGLQGYSTSPECSLEGLILKLKLQYFGHLMRRAESFEKTLMLGKIEGRRRRRWQRMRWLDGITDSLDMGLVNSGIWWGTGRPGVLRFMGLQRVRHKRLNWLKGDTERKPQRKRTVTCINLNMYVLKKYVLSQFYIPRMVGQCSVLQKSII